MFISPGRLLKQTALPLTAGVMSYAHEGAAPITDTNGRGLNWNQPVQVGMAFEGMLSSGITSDC